MRGVTKTTMMVSLFPEHNLQPKPPMPGLQVPKPHLQQSLNKLLTVSSVAFNRLEYLHCQFLLGKM